MTDIVYTSWSYLTEPKVCYECGKRAHFLVEKCFVTERNKTVPIPLCREHLIAVRPDAAEDFDKIYPAVVLENPEDYTTLTKE